MSSPDHDHLTFDYKYKTENPEEVSDTQHESILANFMFSDTSKHAVYKYQSKFFNGR